MLAGARRREPAASRSPRRSAPPAAARGSPAPPRAERRQQAPRPAHRSRRTHRSQARLPPGPGPGRGRGRRQGAGAGAQGSPGAWAPSAAGAAPAAGGAHWTRPRAPRPTPVRQPCAACDWPSAPGPASPRPGWPRGPPVRAPAGRGFREPRRGRCPLWRPARAAACGAGCAERRAPGGGVPEGGPGSPWGRRASRGDRDPVAKRVRGRVWPGAGRCSRSPAPDPGHPRRAPLRLPRPRPGSTPPLAGPGKEATARGLSLREAGARIFNPADAPDLRPEKGGGAVQTRVRRRWLREGRLAASAGSWERLGLAGASPGRGSLSPRNGESGSVFPASAQGLASRLRSAQLRRASPLASQNMGSPCRLPPHRASPKPQVPALRNLS